MNVIYIFDNMGFSGFTLRRQREKRRRCSVHLSVTDHRTSSNRKYLPSIKSLSWWNRKCVPFDLAKSKIWRRASLTEKRKSWMIAMHVPLSLCAEPRMPSFFNDETFTMIGRHFYEFNALIPWPLSIPEGYNFDTEFLGTQAPNRSLGLSPSFLDGVRHSKK